ncbi:hypothetical protein A3A95_02065 [Candidatus Nomurabacteria bacterium RIFCSPLOWO2_01_FULL_39_18]|uniref:Prepilin peptidase n=1 Tax=Candidatus Nomurabacteria bacterium RIFCSPHIGHO2_01_FULL_40_24b TaxID=1801739 RepID=A0A1F6V9B8_9BACT|nr:MAG: hypothetical protein A2647_00650 [Candidatus Nomurabacteria bacterium RIFCSPHIGHO2_01_FULL_40_24b]OGI90649.1 MAG: hypothetical protein A3A95_02065 [Candidatus Nomurabacteria bacterium RIFCSPLOWO2_01_FULL_39_18]
MDIIITIIFFSFGLIIGSFLNVIIYRYNTARSLGGRSACMSCQNKLCWYELIPLLSFVTLRGRCKTCKTKISVQYPLVELMAGLVSVSLFFKFQYMFFIDTFVFTGTYAYYMFMFSLLLVIAVYDLKHKVIPDQLSLFFGILAFLGLFVFTSYGFLPHTPSILELLSGILIASPFALFWLISKGAWMGLGDAKLALGLGWLLGLSRALSGLVVAFWSGAIIGFILIVVSRKYGMKSEIPFAPFLVLGAFLAFILELHFFPFFSS